LFNIKANKPTNPEIKFLLPKLVNTENLYARKPLEKRQKKTWSFHSMTLIGEMLMFIYNITKTNKL